MLVCSSCRESNADDATVCEHCGSELRASSRLRGRTSVPVEIDIPAHKLPPRWRAITGLVVVVLAAAALGTWLYVQPQACDGKYASGQFSYCTTVPAGWNPSGARIGSLQVDQFAHGGATAVVLAGPLCPGATLATDATLAPAPATTEGPTLGEMRATRLRGRAAPHVRGS